MHIDTSSNVYKPDAGKAFTFMDAVNSKDGKSKKSKKPKKPDKKAKKSGKKQKLQDPDAAQVLVDEIIAPEIAKTELKDELRTTLLFGEYPPSILAQAEKILENDGYNVSIRPCRQGGKEVQMMSIMSQNVLEIIF